MEIKMLTRVAGAAALLSIGNAAQASVFCDPEFIALEPSYSVFCPSTAPAVSKETTQATVGTHVAAISQAIRLSSFGDPGERRLAFADGQITGLAAGDGAKAWNFWGNVGETRVGIGYQPLRSSGRVNSQIIGADYRLSKSIVVGASAAFDQTHIGTDFNSGSLSGHGYSIAPYVAVQIDKTWSADLLAGTGRGTQLMSSGGAAIGLDIERSFFGANVNYDRWMGDWQFSGKVGYLDSREEKLGLVDELRQLRVGAQVGYWANGALPYVSLTHSTDLRRPEQAAVFGAAEPANDKTAWVLGVGVNVFSKGALSGGVSYTSELDRKESKQNVLTANLSYRF